MCSWPGGAPQPHAHGSGDQTHPDRPGPPPTPCTWCPLPWVGRQALSHGFGGGTTGLSLLPSKLLRTFWREGGRGGPVLRAGERAGPGSGCSASLVALRDQAPRPRVAALCAVARALGVLGLPLQHPPRGGWAFPTSGGAVRGRERPQQRSGFLGHTPQATLGPLGRVVLGGCWHLGGRGRDSRHPLRPLCSEMSSPEPSGRDGLLREEPCPARWQVGTL